MNRADGGGGLLSYWRIKNVKTCDISDKYICVLNRHTFWIYNEKQYVSLCLYCWERLGEGGVRKKKGVEQEESKESHLVSNMCYLFPSM